jgi:hypothetical protein
VGRLGGHSAACWRASLPNGNYDIAKIDLNWQPIQSLPFGAVANGVEACLI